MRQAGISGLVKVKKGRTTIRVPGVRVADDLVERCFKPDAPNVLWVADITYLRTWEGWLYLAAVQDAYSRRIVGWAMTEHMRAELVADALQMAVARRRPEPGLIHHSDQGSQGGFKWSSQRSIRSGCDGQTARVGFGDDGAAGDAFAGTSDGGAAGGACRVLAGGRGWRVEQRGRGVGRGVGGGWCPLVSGRWGDAYCHFGLAVGALPVVR
jgi:transposase InsO family protein